MHHAKHVKASLTDEAVRISAFSLPSYSPDLNPDEYCCGDWQTALRQEPFASIAEALRENIRLAMETIAAAPVRGCSSFSHVIARYAMSILGWNTG